MRTMWLFIVGLLFCLTIPYGIIYAQHVVCGDGVCSTGEDCENCSTDCGICTSPDNVNPPPKTIDDDSGDDTDNPPSIETQLEMEQLKIKQTSEFSLKGGAIDDLRILWP